MAVKPIDDTDVRDLRVSNFFDMGEYLLPRMGSGGVREVDGGERREECAPMMGELDRKVSWLTLPFGSISLCWTFSQ